MDVLVFLKVSVYFLIIFQHNATEGLICTNKPHSLRILNYVRFTLFSVILLLASAMLYGQKVNNDEAKYTGGWNGVVKRQLDLSIPQRLVLNNLFHKFKNFMDSLPTKTPPHVAIGGATQPEDVSLPLDVTSGYESRDDVFYKAEVGYCYHLGIFGAILGFVSCGLSLYQSWRDSNMSSGIQRL